MSMLEKQDLPQSSHPVPQEAVQPLLHPSKDIMEAIQSGDLRADALLQSLSLIHI